MSDRNHGSGESYGQRTSVQDAGETPAPTTPEILSIENVAAMFNVTRLLLLSFEFRGLIRRRQRIRRIRVYSWADCERIAFILKCRDAGLTLHDIAPVMEAADCDASISRLRDGQRTCMALVDRFELRRKAIEEALAELSHLHALLSTKLLGLGEGINGRGGQV
jgi:DNA-binding transcriptional MerR regulator